MGIKYMRTKVIKSARRDHQCEWCSEGIEKRSEYIRRSGIKYCVFEIKLHGECKDAMDNSEISAGGLEMRINKRGESK